MEPSPGGMKGQLHWGGSRASRGGGWEAVATGVGIWPILSWWERQGGSG